MSAQVDKFAWLKAVYAESEFTDGQKAVLAYVAVFNVLHGRDSFQVRQSTIAAQCHISRRTVGKAIVKAKHEGYLAMSRRRATGYGRNGADELRLSLPGVSEERSHHSGPRRPGVSEERSHHSGPNRSDANKMHESCEQNDPSEAKNLQESCEVSSHRHATRAAETMPLQFLKPVLETSFGERGASAARTPEVIPDEEIIDGEIADDEPEDPEPHEFCPAHMPEGTIASCAGCMRARKRHERWTGRQKAKAAAELFTRRAEREAVTPPYRCNVCQDSGLVITSDGTPGSQPRICHHDRSWHIATPEELAELAWRKTS